MKWLSDRSDVGVLMAKRQYDKAIKVLDRRLREDPESVSLRLQLADALELSGERKKAIQVLAKLVDELATEGFVAKAIALLKKIQRIDPSVVIEDKLARLLPEHEPGTSHLVPPRPAPGSERVLTDSKGTVITSEVVLAEAWLGDAEQRDDFHWSPLFSGLSQREVAELFAKIRLIVKKPGSIVYTEGETGDSFFVLAQGTARAYRRDTRGHNRQVNVLRSGDFFGIRAVLGHSTRIRTVTAAADCELLEIDKASFERMAQRHPHMREQVVNIATELDTD